MVELGYYSNRLKELEKRKDKVQGDLVTAKLGLNGINKEIEACKNEMNNLTKSINEKADKKDKLILKLQDDVEKLKESEKSLKKENTELKHEIKSLKFDLRLEKRAVDKLKSEPESVLQEKINQLRDERIGLKKQNKQLKNELRELKKQVADNELVKIMSIKSDDDTIFSDKFGKENIFEEIRSNK